MRTWCRRLPVGTLTGNSVVMSAIVIGSFPAVDLGVGVVADRQGTVRLVYPTPTWDDVVELALDEIRSFGAGQYQVARRLRSLLDALIADVPERRRPALVAQDALLADAVAHSYGEIQRRAALVPDPQGIGMSHRGNPDEH